MREIFWIEKIIGTKKKSVGSVCGVKKKKELN